MITISLKVFTSSDSYNDNGCQLAYIGCLHFALTTEKGVSYGLRLRFLFLL